MRTFRLRANPDPPNTIWVGYNQRRRKNGLEEQTRRFDIIKKSLAKDGFVYVGIDAEGFETWQKGA